MQVLYDLFAVAAAKHLDRDDFLLTSVEAVRGDESLQSLLVRLAPGDEAVARITARRKAPDPALFVGSGKADEIKANQRAAWAGLSAGWEKWDSIIMSQLAPVTAAMVKEAAERLVVA